MDNGTKFWNRMAKRYSKSPVSDEETYQLKLRKTREYFDSTSNVLEIGCGTGTTAIGHAPYVKHILATDYSAGMLDIARTRAAEARVENVTFLQTDAATVAAPDETFDVVMAHSLLHLVVDPSAVIAQVHSLLKPGGIFVTSTACMSDVAPWIKPLTPLGRAVGLLPSLTFFTRAQLEGMIKSAGFEIIDDHQPSKKAAVFLVARKPR